MALSGTLETFSLPDVLRLLASTAKTGRLALRGDRGTGEVWVDAGAIVAAASERAVHADLDGAVFELLRFVDAAFEFEPSDPPDDVEEPRSVDDALETAEARLAEWREIESVVPSLDVWVRMAPEIDDQLTVNAAQWRVLARVGTGLSGNGLARDLEQGEFDVCRQLRDLVEAGMVEVDELPAVEEQTTGPDHEPTTTDDHAGPTLDDEPSFAEPALSSHEVSSLGANLASFVAAGSPDEPDAPDAPDAPAGPDVSVEAPAIDDELDAPAATDGELALVEDAVDDVSTTAAGDAPAAVDPLDAMVDTGDAELDEVDQPTADGGDTVWAEAPDREDGTEAEVVAGDDADDDFLSQLSHLSPKAAAAIEATSSPDERGDLRAETNHDGDLAAPATDGPLAAADDADDAGEDIDQNLLLRFLSSAKH